MIISGALSFFQKYRQVLTVLLIVLISIPTFWRVLKPGYFKMHDDLQVVRVYEMTKCINDGQIPCRWVPDMGYRFGYPQFNYYGPLPYYFMSFFNLLGLNLFDSMKIGFIAPAILGNIAMYYLGLSLFGSAGGFISAILYAYSPYRGSDTFTRGAMGEVWAFVFLPLIAITIKKIVDKPSLKNSSFLALSFAGLLATHNITTLIFTPLILIYAAFLILHKSNKSFSLIISRSKSTIIAFLWGGAIAAFFFLPVVFEKQFAHTETMVGGYFDYRAHFASIKQLFFTSFWSYGSSEIGPADDLSFFYSPLMLLAVATSTVLLVLKLIKKEFRKLEFVTVIFIGLGLISSFMVHEKSSFIWGMIPTLMFLQFPWRFLILGNFFFAIAGAYSFATFTKSKAKWAVLVFFVFVFLFSYSFFRPIIHINITPMEKFSGTLWDKQMTISIFDYLPTSAATPPTFPAPYYPISSSKYSSLENYTKGTNWLSFDYQSLEKSSVALNILDFPGWKVFENNQEISHNTNNLGIITIELDPGSHHILAKLTDTPVRLVGNLLTLVFLPLALYIAFIKRGNGT